MNCFEISFSCFLLLFLTERLSEETEGCGTLYRTFRYNQTESSRTDRSDLRDDGKIDGHVVSNSRLTAGVGL